MGSRVNIRISYSQIKELINMIGIDTGIQCLDVLSIENDQKTDTIIVAITTDDINLEYIPGDIPEFGQIVEAKLDYGP